MVSLDEEAVAALSDEEKTHLMDVMSEDQKILDKIMGDALDDEDPEHALNTALASLGTYVSAKNVLIFEMVGRNRVDCSYEWVSAAGNELAGEFQAFNFKKYSDAWREVFNKDGVAIELEGSEVELVAGERVVVAPIVVEGRRVGYGAVIDASAESLNDHVRLIRRVIAFMGVLIRTRNEARDEDKVNYRDSLTEAQNRMSLYEQAKSLNKNEPIGLVYCDLNGLRAINEERGFKAGDNAIIALSKVLLKNFRNEDVFRLSEDEFLAWLPVLNEKAFERRIAKVKRHLAKEDIDVAMGAQWFESWESMEIDRLIMKVDALRYESKHEDNKNRRE